jgi:hypothetical protein
LSKNLGTAVEVAMEAANAMPADASEFDSGLAAVVALRPLS